MANDGFKDIASGPATTMDLVVPADSDLARPIRALFITGAGVVKYTTLAGDVRALTFPANFRIDCAMIRVWSTGTTSSGEMHGYI